MNDLIERLKARCKRQELVEGPGFVDPDIKEAITALSPVLPEDVEAVVFHNRALKTPDGKEAADLIERQAKQLAYLEIPYFLRQPGAIENDVREYVESLTAERDKLRAAFNDLLEWGLPYEGHKWSFYEDHPEHRATIESVRPDIKPEDSQ